MSERWKPENLETYFYVGRDFEAHNAIWLEDFPEKTRLKKGNCFRTEAEAKAAAEKIKALLFCLHEPATECSQSVTNSSQLPKLTTEVFDRPDCPKWVQWAAVDSNGAGYYYSEKPFIMSEAFGWCMVCSETNRSELICGEFNNSDWQNSLIERPATLPDWCKVGEWVYLSNAKYYKIKKVDSYGIILNNGIVIKTDDIHAEAVSARLRPYNADEMRELVGDVFEDKDGNLYLAVSYIPHGRGLLIGGFYFNAEELLDANFTLDGKPCGKLEHLENGEWVE